MGLLSTLRLSRRPTAQQRQKEERRYNELAKAGKPPGTKRLCVILSVVLFVVMGVPVWWRTTSVFRPTLPIQRIESWAESIAARPLRLPVYLEIWIEGVGTADAFDSVQKCAWDIHNRTLEGMGYKTITQKVFPLGIRIVQCGTLDCKTVASAGDFLPGRSEGPCFNISQSTCDNSSDDALLGSIERAGRAVLGSYVLIVRNGQGSSAPKVCMGKYRHAVAHMVDPWSRGALQSLASIAVDLLVHHWGQGSGPNAEKQGGQLPVSPASQVLMSFSLCNANPNDGYWTWDFDRFEETWLRPVLVSIEAVMNVDVESQVLYHTSTDVKTKYVRVQHAHVVKASALPFFVSSEWQLDSGRTVTSRNDRREINRTHTAHLSSVLSPVVLHWVVFIPPSNRRPMRIVDDTTGHASKTNAFKIPSWGGVLIINPSKAVNESAADRQLHHDLEAVHYWEIAAVFVAQLRGLLGLPETPKATDSVQSLPSEVRGFADWEVDVLLRQRAAADVKACADTLVALARVMQKLPNLEMPNFIGAQVVEALTAGESAVKAAAAGDYALAVLSTRRARRLAEEAFTHPSILTQLNFPDQHKVAIYIPLFLPALVAVAAALTSEVTRFLKRRSVSAAWRNAHRSSAG
eukprot:evm.model.scf_788EXC.6 EVM.evm.TU.scf_788EXC.6   scf_788EXC:46730-54418(+)